MHRSAFFASLPVAVCGSSSTTTHGIRQPPFRHLALIDRAARTSGSTVRPGRGTTSSSGRSSHFGCARRDDRRLGDVGVRDGDVLQRDRADPLAARLDHVLGAVGDLHVAVGIDGRDVAGGEPAVGVAARCRAARRNRRCTPRARAPADRRTARRPTAVPARRRRRSSCRCRAGRGPASACAAPPPRRPGRPAPASARCRCRPG